MVVPPDHDRALLIDALMRATTELATAQPTIAESRVLQSRIHELLAKLGAGSAMVPFDLVEPIPKKVEPPSKPKPAIIVVSVREGERPQNGIPVELRDNQGVLKFKGTTGDVKNKDGVAEPGKIVFKDLPAGTYKVSAVRTASSTKGEETTTVKDGDEKAINIRLFR